MVLGALAAIFLVAWRETFAAFSILDLPPRWEPSEINRRSMHAQAGLHDSRAAAR